MKQNYTHVSILIDKSGSMNSIKSSVIKGFNDLIDDQKSEDGELTVSLVQFDSIKNKLRYDTLNNFSPINEVTLLDQFNYIPDGSTPLNDALTKIINETGLKLSSMNEEDRPSKVLIVSITDGKENSSTEFTSETVKRLIEHQEQVYNWQFMYIGANQNVQQEGGSRGFKSNYSFTSNDSGTIKMNKVISSTLKTYRSYSSADKFNLVDALESASKEVDNQDIK